MFGSRQNPIIASDAILSDEEINLIIQNNVSQLHIQQIGQIDSLTARLNIASNTNNNLSADMQDLRMENVALQNRILHYKLNEQTAIDKIANLQREINYLRDLIGNKNLPVIIPNPRTQPRATSTAYASSSQQPLSGNINSHWHNQHNLPPQQAAARARTDPANRVGAPRKRKNTSATSSENTLPSPPADFDYNSFLNEIKHPEAPLIPAEAPPPSPLSQQDVAAIESHLPTFHP